MKILDCRLLRILLGALRVTDLVNTLLAETTLSKLTVFPSEKGSSL